jgi:peptidoglycan hydrolase-like protein with peptidoglycan-binding domain
MFIVAGAFFSTSFVFAMEMMDGGAMSQTNLGLGARGSDVIALQTTLEAKGFLVLPNGVAKGYFGNITKTALAKYQRSLGVHASGYYGQLTRASMKAMMMKGGTGAMMEKKDAMVGGAMMEKKDGAMMSAGVYET